MLNTINSAVYFNKCLNGKNKNEIKLLSGCLLCIAKNINGIIFDKYKSGFSHWLIPLSAYPTVCLILSSRIFYFN